MLKRPRDIYDTPCSSTPPDSPSKRVHTDPGTREASPLSPTPLSTFSTPLSYRSPRTPFSVPSDSPTNPFGLKRSLTALDLPPKTSFGKHIALRFQLVDTSATPPTVTTRRGDKGGIYRVVQVPKNYTFRHLHKLILFLFASDIERLHNLPSTVYKPPRGRKVSSKVAQRNASSKATRASSRHDRTPSHRSSEKWSGHTFEALERITVHSGYTKPGVIKEGGRIRAKLSSVRERRLFRDLFLAPTHGASGEVDEVDDEDESQAYNWEAVDDYTINHVWPSVPQLDCGIIYHHSATVSVHITANTLPVPARKGIGNKPYVFIAKGLAGNSIKMAHVTLRPNGEEGITDTEDDEPPLAHRLRDIPIIRWNSYEAFEQFLQLEGDRERKLQGWVKPPSTSGRANSSSVSPLRDRNHYPSETESEGETSFMSDDILFPFALSAITPYPTHPARRKRVEYAERKLERLTRSGLSKMCSSDEEDSRKKRAAKGGALDVSDNDGEKEVDDDWDPFGDEEEV